MLKQFKNNSDVVGEMSTHFLLHGFIIMLEMLKSAKWCDLYTETEIIQMEAL